MLVFIKKASALLLCALLIVLTLCGCSDEDKSGNALTVWVYSDTYKSELEHAIKSDLTGIDFDIDILCVDSAGFADKLNLALAEGGLPDIVMLSPSNISEFVESGLLVPFSELGIEINTGKYYEYTLDMGTTSNGELVALCWQPDPGAFFYRRSLAKVYLGSDNPSEVQNMLSDWDKFYKTAQTLSEQSGGKTCIVAGTDDLMLAYMANPDSAWVENGELAIGETAVDFLEYSRKLAQEELIGDIEMWSPAWAAGISDTQSVFGYFSSALGLEGALKAACGGTISGEGSYGDWACCKGPQSFNWGGCWLGVLETSKKRDEAAIFLEYLLCEEEAMERNALISGSFSANITVVEEIKYDAQFIDPFLGGQNGFSVLTDAARDISADKLTKYDSALSPAFSDCAREYAFGYRTLEDTLSDFRLAAASLLSE